MRASAALEKNVARRNSTSRTTDASAIARRCWPTGERRHLDVHAAVHGVRDASSNGNRPRSRRAQARWPRSPHVVRPHVDAFDTEGAHRPPADVGLLEERVRELRRLVGETEPQKNRTRRRRRPRESRSMHGGSPTTSGEAMQDDQPAVCSTLPAGVGPHTRPSRVSIMRPCAHGFVRDRERRRCVASGRASPSTARPPRHSRAGLAIRSPTQARSWPHAAVPRGIGWTWSRRLAETARRLSAIADPVALLEGIFAFAPIRLSDLRTRAATASSPTRRCVRRSRLEHVVLGGNGSEPKSSRNAWLVRTQWPLAVVDLKADGAKAKILRERHGVGDGRKAASGISASRSGSMSTRYHAAPLRAATTLLAWGSDRKPSSRMSRRGALY